MDINAAQNLDQQDPFLDDLPEAVVGPDVTQNPPANQQQQQAAPQNVIQFTPEQVAQMFAANQQVAPQTQQQQMSPEQMKEHFKTFDPDQTFLENFATALQPNQEGKVDLDKVKNVVSQLRDGLIAQAFRLTELHTQQQVQQVTQQFTPMQQAYLKQQEQAVWGDFTKNYPALTPFKTLVDATAQQMAPSLAPQLSREQKFQLVAQAVESQIKAFNPGFVLSAPGQNNRQSSPTMPQQNAMTGAGYAPMQGSPKPNGNPFYDPILD